MKALSIRQPWAWLVASGVKDIENRTWDTRYRGMVLIHAGKALDVDGFRNWPLGCTRETAHTLGMGGIIGVALLTGTGTRWLSTWYEGAPNIGWRMDAAARLPFSPLKGSLGLFNVTCENLLPETLAALAAWRQRIAENTGVEVTA
jgi:hypothetical protein